MGSAFQHLSKLRSRLTRLLEAPHYIVGRFVWVRTAYSAWRWIHQTATGRGPLLLGEIYEPPRIPLAISSSGYLRTSASAAQQAREMKDSAYSVGPHLSDEAVTQIVRAASERPLRRPDDSHGRFTYAEFSTDSELRRDTAYATIVDSSELPIIKAIAGDPAICEAAERFLGYKPRQVLSWLFWSFANGLSDDQRRGVHQTIDYHYDVDGYNFMYANFYLLKTGARNGAHALIVGSNTRKRLRNLLSTSQLGDTEAVNVYGRDAERVLEGPPGFGFLEDASCYHKALAPKDSDRLMLQLRYR